MQVAVAHAAAVENHHLVQQRGVAVRGLPQPVEVVSEKLSVIAADLGQLGQAFGLVLVVRQRVVRVGHPDLGIGLGGELGRHQEGDDAGHVGLVRQQLKVEHHLDVLAERGRRARRRTLDGGQLAVRIGLGPLNAPLDVAHRGQIVGQLGLVGRPEPLPQPRRLPGHRVENAAVLPPARAPRLGAGGAAVSEQPLEQRPRVALHRQRRRRRAPAQGADVGATEAGVAGPGELRQADAHFERGELGAPAEHRRRDLVHRRAGAEVGPLGRLRVHPGQERAGDAPVAARGVARQLGRGGVVEPRQDQQPVAERLQRLQDRGELEPAPLDRGGPVAHDRPVRHVHHAQPRLRLRRRPLDRGQRGNHAVEQRQGHRRPEAAEHGTPGKRLSGDDHDSDLLIWNGRLRAMPRTMDDQR